MQNGIQKFKQDFVFFEKSGILSEKLKTEELQLPQSLIIFAENLHMFPT